MARKYTETEAWSIFFGGFVIGVVLTSVFWAYTTGPGYVKKVNKEALDTINVDFTEPPMEFVEFCRKISGKPEWDNTGYKSCTLRNFDQKNLITMNVMCKRYNLNLTYGSFGVKCEGYR